MWHPYAIGQPAHGTRQPRGPVERMHLPDPDWLVCATRAEARPLGPPARTDDKGEDRYGQSSSPSPASLGFLRCGTGTISEGRPAALSFVFKAGMSVFTIAFQRS